MGTTIEEWRIKEFSNNVYHLSQQKDSRMWAASRQETMHSKRKFFDVLGSTEAVVRSVRNGDTPNLDIAHSRRAVDLVDYNWGKLVDDVDILRNLNDPTNEYAKAMVMGFKRRKDKVIRDAMLGLAYYGEEGGSSIALPTAQKIAAVASGALSNMNIETLRFAKYKFDAADIDPDLPRFLAVTPSQIRALLAQTEVTSSDYASVKALVMGQIDTFMGFKFIQTNLLENESDSSVKFNLTTGAYDGGGTASTGRKCIAWVPDGVIVATGIDLKTRVDERADKNYSTQVYGEMSIGATRLEDVKVLYIGCKES